MTLKPSIVVPFQSPKTEIPADMSEPLLTAEQIGARLQVPHTWVRRHIPAIALGRYKRWRWSSVEKWLREQETK